MTELRALTSIRGIAAWFVVLFHIRASIAGLPDAALAVFTRGYLAVDFFFLLSGFVIWLSYAERLRAGGHFAEFMKRRIARIWPLHLFILGCGVALAVALSLTGRPDPGAYPFRELPLHVLLIQNWGFTEALSWNDPAWSISAELGAYLLFPLLALAIDWRRVPTVAILMALGGLFVLLHAVLSTMGAETLGDDIPRFGLLRCLIEFAAGTGVGALWVRYRNVSGTVGAISASIGIMLVAAWLSGAVPETFAVPSAFAALLLALALTSGMRHNPLTGRTLHYLGEISYATYLGHYMLWIVFKLILVRDAGAVPPALIALYLGLVLVGSIILYHGIERPAQRFINRWRVPIRLRPDRGNARGIAPGN